MDWNTLLVEDSGAGIFTLTLQRPEQHNAMNLEMIRELRNAFDELSRKASLRGLVLSGGNGPSFCAGGDLRWMQGSAQQPAEQRRAEARELAEMLAALNDFPALTLARINGAAYGGGLGLIACCDLAVAVETAQFALTEVRLGLIPATISPFVVGKLGGANSRRVMLHAKRFNAYEAQALGLISDIAADLEALDQAISRELKLLVKCAPEAVRTTKQLICTVENQAPETVREYTVKCLSETWETDSTHEGVSAFFEKRPPEWAT